MSSEKSKQPWISSQPAPAPYPSAPPAYGAPTSQGYPGYQPQPAMMGQGYVDHTPPPDYLVLSIFTILCCFWPLGLVGLIKSIDARNNYQNGQYALAQASARDAKRFNVIGIGVGIGILVFAVILTFISVIPAVIIAISAAANNNN